MLMLTMITMIIPPRHQQEQETTTTAVWVNCDNANSFSSSIEIPIFFLGIEYWGWANEPQQTYVLLGLRISLDFRKPKEGMRGRWLCTYPYESVFCSCLPLQFTFSFVLMMSFFASLLQPKNRERWLTTPYIFSFTCYQQCIHLDVHRTNAKDGAENDL